MQPSAIKILSPSVRLFISFTPFTAVSNTPLYLANNIEKEVSKIAQSIKRHVFHDMDNFKLSQKFHLRYFALHVEELAEEAVKVADRLAILVIQQN